MFQTALDAFYPGDTPNYILPKRTHEARVDCYLAVLKKYRAQFPRAHFEVVTRTAGSPLAPSWKLLDWAKTHEITFPQYAFLLLKELKERPEAKHRLFVLRRIVKDRTVFLVCFEKNPAACHRTIIKHVVDELWPPLDLETLKILFPGE